MPTFRDQVLAETDRVMSMSGATQTPWACRMGRVIADTVAEMYENEVSQALIAIDTGELEAGLRMLERLVEESDVAVDGPTS